MSKHYIITDCSSAPTHKQVLAHDRILAGAAVGLTSSGFGVKPSWKSFFLLVEQHHFILLS